MPSSSKPERDSLVQAIRVRASRYAAGEDQAILGWTALTEVGALLATIESPADEPELARIAGLVLWFRSSHQPAEDDHEDLIPALALLAPAWRATPDRVPPAVAEFFTENGTDTVKTSDAWHGPALALAGHVRRTRDAAAATVVVELLRRVVTVTPADDPEYGECLSNLAVAAQTRFELTDASADLDEAVAVGRQALAAFSTGDARRVVPVASLAVALRRRFGLTADTAALDEAIELGREALRATATGGRDRPDRLTNTGVALQYRFERSGHAEDGEQAVALQWEAVTATPLDDHRRAARLVNLAAALNARFEATGATADLEEAIAAGQAAATVEGADPVTRAALGSSMCSMLRLRFRYTGRSADLDDAVRAGESAVALLAPGHPDRGSALANLGLARHVRFQRRASAPDLDRAIDELREAVDATFVGHPDLPGRLSNLCDALLTRAQSVAGPADLDAAIGYGRRAADAATHHPRRALFLSNLGNALLTRYELTGERAALDQSIAAGQEAVDACPPGAPHLATCLANLGVALHARSATDAARSADLDLAIAAARRATGEPSGRSDVRIRAAARWGHWSATRHDWQGAAAGLGEAVRLLRRVSPADLPRTDQEFELARLGGLGCDAAACALNAGDVPAAVRLLEQGRGIVLAQALGHPTGADGVVDTWPDAAAVHHLAADGPIAMLNVSGLRCDALILARDGIVVQPLPDLTPAALREQTEAFLIASSIRAQGDAAAEQRLTAVLAWLWDTVAEPVLRRLGLTAPAAGDRAGSRLWWCATGLLSLLPVHAAGRPGAPGVLDLVVSSVTPTLRALAHARRPAAAPRPGPGRDIVVVATPDLTGQVPLPAAAAERAMLAELFPGRVDTLEGDLATREAVLTAMITHRRIHLACHATADLRNPSRSMLVLADHERAPLTAADISALRLSDAELAFLSACDTARTAPALSDEAVHLASVLHIAGYRQVVATLWPISDRPAMRLSRAVYGRLATHDEESLAHALHAAVHAQRHRYPRHPFVWAGHVHLGG